MWTVSQLCFRSRRPTWLLQRSSLWRRRQPASVLSAGTERVITERVTGCQYVFNCTNYYTVGLSRCVAYLVRLLTYSRQSWTAIAIGMASITNYQACDTTDKNDVWWPSVRSCRSTGKHYIPNGLMCADNGWENGTVEWHQLYIADGDLAKLLSWTRHSCSSQLSVLYANIIPTHASDADKPNDCWIVFLCAWTLTTLG